MCEFLITIKTPYTTTLLIDDVHYPLKDNKCTVKIDNKNEHSLKITISKEEKNFFWFDFLKAFKFKGRLKDEFCDLIYMTNFKLNSKHNSAKADFEYKKGIFTNHLGKQIDIPYISTKLKKVEFYNSKNTLFKSKFDLLLYIIRHRWVEGIIYAFLMFLNLHSIIDTLLTYKDNYFVTLEYYSRFANTPIEEIIFSSITLLFLTIFILCENLRFFRKLNCMRKYSGDNK